MGQWPWEQFSLVFITNTDRDVPIWNFANDPITNWCIKLSADTDIDAYVQSLSFHAR